VARQLQVAALSRCVENTEKSAVPAFGIGIGCLKGASLLPLDSEMAIRLAGQP
jgi:hypothetical protein